MKEETFEDVYLRALIYGDSGSGKTRLTGTAMQCVETSPMLTLNARGQPISYRFLRDKWYMPLVLSVETMRDFNDTYAWIMDNQPLPTVLKEFVDKPNGDAWDAKVAGLPEPFNYIYRYLGNWVASGHSTELRFRCFTVDSITQVQRISSDVVMDYDDAAYSPSGFEPKKRGYTEYQQMLDMMMKFSDHHYKLPIHVIMTALCRHSEMPTLGYTRYYPFLWGQSALEVPSYAELVGRLINIDSMSTQQINVAAGQFTPIFKGEQPFNVLFTRGGRDFVAKWQGPDNPPDILVNPTVRKILDVINGG